MKKVISFFIIISFLLVLTALSTINQSKAEINSTSTPNQVVLEKIPSPQHINLYEKIKKIGNTLWGIRKIEKKQEKLEKISTPKDISLFEKVKKVGNTLWGIRKKMLYRTITSEAAPCVIAAIEAKDKALTENNTKTTNELNNAIASRTTCQKTALGTTDNQKSALDECLRIFKEAHKQIKNNSYKAHQNIWKTYLDSLKVCSKTASSSMVTSTAVYAAQEFKIEDGGGNIIEISGDND